MTLSGTEARAFRTGRAAAGGLCLLLACSWSAQAQQTDRSRETEGRIRQEREAIDRVRRGQASVLEVLDEIEADLVRKTQRLKTLNALLKRQQRDLDEAAAAAAAAAAALEQGRKALAGRVRALYRWRRAGTPFVLLNGDFSAPELMRRKRRLETVLGRDRELVRNLSRDVRRSRDLREDVEARRRKLSGEHDAVAALRAGLEEERARNRRTLARLLEELQQACIRLERIITEAGKRPAGSTTAPDPAAAGCRPAGRVVVAPPRDRAAAGRMVEIPVTGRVVSGFGVHKHPELDVDVHRPGIDIAASAGAAVRAMDRGRVIFAGRMPGYGRTLILDHDRRYHTVYGRLSELDKAVEDRVERGERIAWVGDRGSSGESRLYFEVREDGKPVDPVPRFDRPASRRRR